MSRTSSHPPWLSAAPLAALAGDACRRLSPRLMARNPVMFVVLLGTLLSLCTTIADLLQGRPWLYDAGITFVLLVTVLFANAAEALAESRGRAQAASLRQTRDQLLAVRVRDGREERVTASQLAVGDRVRVRAGELIQIGRAHV